MKLSVTRLAFRVTSQPSASCDLHSENYSIQLLCSKVPLSSPGQSSVSRSVHFLRSNVACDTSSGCKYQICDKQGTFAAAGKMSHSDYSMSLVALFNLFVFSLLSKLLQLFSSTWSIFCILLCINYSIVFSEYNVFWRNVKLLAEKKSRRKKKPKLSHFIQSRFEITGHSECGFPLGIMAEQ